MTEWILQYWIQVLFGLMVSIGGVLCKLVAKKYKIHQEEQKVRLKSQEDEQAIIKQGVLGLLHNSLFQECKLLLKEGEMTENDFNNIESLYSAYSSLGGNGTGTQLYNRVKKLEFKDNED